MDIEMAGPAIFQGSEETMEISVDPTTVTSPSRPYLAVCITFMDIQGKFHFFDDPKQGPPCSPYAIKHLYAVESNKGVLTFRQIYTSVEGTGPQLDPKQPCYGE